MELISPIFIQNDEITSGLLTITDLMTKKWVIVVAILAAICGDDDRLL